MTMNGATGVSGSTRNSAGGIGNLNKISSAIDRLNRTIDKLSNQMTRMGQQALDRGREVMTRGGGGVVDVGSPVAPVAHVARGKAGPKTAMGQWVKANRFTRADAMPLFMLASWGRQMGSSLEDLGMNTAGSTLSFLGDVAGGAATGAIRGGPWGAAIGGLIAGLVSATAALAQWEKSLREVSKGFAKTREGIEDFLISSDKQRGIETWQDKLDNIRNSDDGDYTKQLKYEEILKHATIQEQSKESALKDDRKILEREMELATALEEAANDYAKYQNTALKGMGWLGLKVKHFPDWFVERANAAKGGKDFLPLDTLKELLKRQNENLKKYKDWYNEDEAQRKQWKSIRQEAERGIKTQQKSINKFMDNYEEEQKKNAEKRKKLTDRRSNLLLDIEDDYTQQGVDLLTSMGKAGKYMSAMEMASLNQERFSPITKKMDDM